MALVQEGNAPSCKPVADLMLGCCCEDQTLCRPFGRSLHCLRDHPLPESSASSKSFCRVLIPSRHLSRFCLLVLDNQSMRIVAGLKS